MADGKSVPSAGTKRDAVDAFLRHMAAVPAPVDMGRCRGRLMFALDATASRQPTWDRACDLQGEMFLASEALGGLEIQLVYYRGFRECRSSGWVNNATALLQRMTAVSCLGGRTQIVRVLRHALKETTHQRVHAVVFVGDHMEEPVDDLCHVAGQLGLAGTPVFLFHEGGEPGARVAFEQVARLSHGAYCPFDAHSADQLRQLLGAVAAFAAGGVPALEAYGRGKGDTVQRLTYMVAGTSSR